MKGASAYILSPAAELATRGMDSADEEPELPSPVQDFIRRLGEKSLKVEFEFLLSRPEVKGFFPEGAPLSTNTGWRSQVRLRVLEAIGSCISSSELLDVADIFGGNISTLTASEWEVVLRGFRSSSVLRKMRIRNLRWSSDADLESLGLQLGIILNTSSAAALRIWQRGLTARFFLNLASGLRENSHSILKSLEVLDLRNGNAVKFIVEVLNGHHQLETLTLLSSIHDGVDDAAVRLLSQTLKQNSCLRELVLEGVEDGSAALLLYALAGDDGNRSIEQLELRVMSGIGKSEAEVFISNRSLRVVMLKAITMPVEEWRLLGEAIRDNATATTVNVDTELSPSYYNDFKVLVSRSFFNELKQLSCAASSDGKEPLLHMRLDQYFYIESIDPPFAPFKLLSSVLRGEIKSVKSLTLVLRDNFPRRRSIEDILLMNRIIGETSCLKRLHLMFVSSCGLWKHLVQSLRCNTSVTSLSLSFISSVHDVVLPIFTWEVQQEEMFRDLMALLQANLTLKVIDVSETPGQGTERRR